MILQTEKNNKQERSVFPGYFVSMIVVGARSDQCVFDSGYWIRECGGRAIPFYNLEAGASHGGISISEM